MTSGQPTISVDRMVGHYLDSLEVDTESIGNFYEALPYDDRPSLDDCHIHFSGLGQVEGHRVGKAVWLANPEDSKKHDPQAPAADILVFVGSVMATKSVDTLDEVLGHELTHFAQPKQEEKHMSEDELGLRLQLALMRGRAAKVLFAGKAMMYGGIAELYSSVAAEPISIKEAAVLGLGAATLTSLLKRNKKKRRIKELEYGLHKIYLSREAEEDARQVVLDTSPSGLASANQRPKTPPTLVRKRGSRSNRLADYSHRKLSALPPSKIISVNI